MKIFVSGATGFIGRRLVERLGRQGDRVVALVRRKNHDLPSEIQTPFDSGRDWGGGTHRARV